MGEVVLTNVFEDMKIEASKSSEVSLFARFRKHYQMIPQTLIRQLDMTGFSAEGELLAEELRVVTLLQVSQDHDFRRDDYKELIELLFYFSMETSGNKSYSRNQEPCTRPDGWRNFFTQSDIFV